MEGFNSSAFQILTSIDFPKRFKELSGKYNAFEARLTVNDKKSVINILSDLGYPVKYKEGHFILKETFEDNYLHLALNIKSGIVLTRLTVYKDNAFWNLNSGNFAFIYRSLIGDMSAQITAPIFSNYEELKEILKEILNIYEDFKKKLELSKA